MLSIRFLVIVLKNCSNNCKGFAKIYKQYNWFEKSDPI